MWTPRSAFSAMLMSPGVVEVCWGWGGDRSQLGGAYTQHGSHFISCSRMPCTIRCLLYLHMFICASTITCGLSLGCPTVPRLHRHWYSFKYQYNKQHRWFPVLWCGVVPGIYFSRIMFRSVFQWDVKYRHFIGNTDRRI